MRKSLLGLCLLLCADLRAQEPDYWLIGPGLCGDPHWKPPVATTLALPLLSNDTGDVAFVSGDQQFWFWNGGAWQTTAAGAASGPAGGDLAGTYPNPTVAANAVALGTDTTGGYAASATEAGPATTALALAADGANCSSGQFAAGVDASGVVQDCAAPPAGVTDHGALTGLADDDHAQYPLLAGRTGGQTLSGGPASGQSLTLRGNAAATDGAVISKSTIMAPFGTNLALAYSFEGEPSTGWYRVSAGTIVKQYDGTNSHQEKYNRYMIGRSDACYVMEDAPDAGICRIGSGELVITNSGTNAGRGSLTVVLLRFEPQASPPTCTGGSLYSTTGTPSTLCYCNGVAWLPISGAGPC